jgi:hypothetical protein
MRLVRHRAKAYRFLDVNDQPFHTFHRPSLPERGGLGTWISLPFRDQGP